MPYPISICFGNVTVFILREDVEKMFLQILTDLIFLVVPERECLWLLCFVYEWTHQEYIITVPNSFILFQFTCLDPKEEHGHARGSKLSAEQLTVYGISWKKQHSVDMKGEKKWGFSHYFILG